MPTRRQHASGARHRKKNKKNFYFRKTFGIIKESQPRRRFFKMAEAEDDVKNGRVAPITDTFDDLRKMLKED